MRCYLSWMVPGAELVRLVDSDEEKHAQLPHHKQSRTSQTRFKSLVSRAKQSVCGDQGQDFVLQFRKGD